MLVSFVWSISNRVVLNLVQKQAVFDVVIWDFIGGVHAMVGDL